MRQVIERDRKRSTQLCHISLLKPYYSPSSAGSTCVQVMTAALVTVQEGPIVSQQVAADADEFGPDDTVLQPRLKNSETLADLDNLLCHLPALCREELSFSNYIFWCFVGNVQLICQRFTGFHHRSRSY